MEFGIFFIPFLDKMNSFSLYLFSLRTQASAGSNQHYPSKVNWAILTTSLSYFAILVKGHKNVRLVNGV